MKKIIIALLALLVFTGCAKTGEPVAQDEPVISEPTGGDEMLAGGWTINDTIPEINEFYFDQARKKIVGATYSPLFILGTQPVGGENVMYLTYKTNVTPDAAPEFKMVTVFKDVDENVEAEIINVADFNITDYLDDNGSTTPDGLMGGWKDETLLPNMLSDEDNAVFEKAMEGLVGVGYTPVVKLASQVVAGTNFAFLAVGTTVTAEPVSHLYIVKVYNDLQGNAEVTNICGLDLSKFNNK